MIPCIIYDHKAAITVGNEGTDGHVVADAVQWEEG
jgi:hypothetical protein